MKRFYKSVLMVLVLGGVYNSTPGQTPDWLWANSLGGASSNYNERAFSVVTDNSENIYTAGYFISPFIIFGNDTLFNGGPVGNSPDIFIAKYDANGNVLWAKRAGGIDDDRATSLTVDISGNLIIAGFFYSPSIAIGSDTLYSSGIGDLFITKFDSSAMSYGLHQQEGLVIIIIMLLRLFR